MKIKYIIIPLTLSLLFGCDRNNNISSNSLHISEENIITELPDIATLDKHYFDFTSTTDNLTIELLDIPAIKTLHMNGIEVSTRHYLFENHILTIGNGYLVELGYGKHILTINKTTHLAIVVYIDNEPNLIGSNSYKYLGSAHPKFEIAIYGGEITSLIYNDQNYIQYIKSYYANTLTIDASLCEIVLQSGTNNLNLLIDVDLPTGVNTYNIPLYIHVPKTGNYITGTPEYDEIESDYFTSSEDVIL